MIIIIKLLIINFTINYLFHFTGIPEDIRRWFSKRLNRELLFKPPLGCPGCLTFWCSIIYILLNGTIGYWYIIPIAIINHMIVPLIVGITSFILNILNKINN